MSNLTPNNTKAKIKIGYISGDFRKHAVFNLIQDLFLNHDKSNFEIYAYSLFRQDGPEREKVSKNVDYFFPIGMIGKKKGCKING